MEDEIMASGLKDVALKSGVSKSTVSRYLNGGYISKEKKEMIESAIKELHFVSNRNARSLKTNKSDVIALFVPTIDHPFFSRFAMYAEHALYNKNYKLLLVSSGGDTEKEIQIIKMNNEKSIDGAMFLTHNNYSSIPTTMPIVTIDRHFGDHVPCITSDNFEGTYEGLKYLKDLGCKKIGFLGGKPLVESEVNKRFESYIEFCRTEKIVPIYSFEAFEHGQEYDVAKKFLKDNEADGLFCASDLLAYGAYHYLREVSKDSKVTTKIISFDGITDEIYFGVKLTSVKQDIEKMAQKAVDVLLEKISGKEVESKYIIETSFEKGETA